MMTHRILADLVLAFHAAFVVFVMLGGLLALWKRWVIYLHFPALLWGTLVIAMGWVCPLTPLENALRRAAHEARYEGGFIEHYVLTAIYPPGLTREAQILLAMLLILVNAGIYATLWRRRHTRK